MNNFATLELLFLEIHGCAMYIERGSLLLLPIRERGKKRGGLLFLTSFLQSTYSHFGAVASALPRFVTLPGMWRGDVLPFFRLAKNGFISQVQPF